MTANTPPKPHAEGDRFTNTETGITYEFKSGAWRAVSSEAADAVVDAIDGLNLKKVCNAGTFGYITDTPLAIETEKGVSILTEQELRITHEDNPYIRLVDQSDGDALEITLNDDHGHIDMSDINDELHFKFGGVEQITFKGDGAADFKGRVTVERPALGENTSFNVKGGIRNSNDEVVIGNMLRAYHDSSDLTKDSGVEYKGKIYNENNIVNKGYVDTADTQQEEAINDNAADIEAIEGRLDDLERIRNTGRWRLIENISSPSDTEFSLMKSNGTIIRQWNEAVTLNIAEVDNNGIRHDVSGWGEGDKIEVIGDDLNNPAFAVYTLGASPIGARPGMKTVASCDMSEGLPIERIVYRVRRFADSTIDLEQADARYVNISGDTMTGILETTSKIWIRPDNQGANGANNMLVVNQEAATSGSIARFQKNSADVLKIEFDGNTSLMNNRLIKVATPVEDTDGTTKKYVDDAVGSVHGPATHKWTYRAGKDKLDLLPGEFTGPNSHKYGDSKHYSYYFHPESLTSRMGFYKDYDMYFPMNSIWGAFHYWDTNYYPQWKLKQYVPVRNIHMFKDDNYLEIYTHTDYPSGGDVISRFDDGRAYYFTIGGLI